MSNNKQFLLGYDVGSSSVKVSLLDAENDKSMGTAFSPKEEMVIDSPEPGWAEQHPGLWWDHLVKATQELITNNLVDVNEIAGIGISYQMHGLVAVDQNQKVVRPSIIWCDSRATDIGRKAFQKIGPRTCLKRFLNSPGNFTASKLKWVMDNEPETYKKIHKIMLPGDFIAMKMTGEITTTQSGLSEGILWDYTTNSVAGLLLEHYGFSKDLIPETKTSFSNFGELSEKSAKELGLRKGIPVTYKAGDQPNNAFSLNVIRTGEIATTAGTSGVIYGITDKPSYDAESRVNTFVHVNHEENDPSYGVLLCINGTGILYRWIRQNLMNGSLSYEEMNNKAMETAIGSDGIVILPFGNGAERILENQNIGSAFLGIDFNRHGSAHLLRAAQEGIVFSMRYGFDIMKNMGVDTKTVKAGHANMFQSQLFRQAFVNTTGTVLELYKTDGSEGAARGAGLGAGVYENTEQAFERLERLEVIEPKKEQSEEYETAYQRWAEQLDHQLNKFQ